MSEKIIKPYPQECKLMLLAMNDTMQLLSGKWKTQIIGTMFLYEKMRFTDILREVQGIRSKMLSKELQELEDHHVVTRTVVETKPVSVLYSLTPHGRTLEKLINEIALWGLSHRKELIV